MVDQRAVNRPQVRGTVILSAFIGAVSLLEGWSYLSPIINLRSISVPDFYMWAIYVALGLGVLMLVAASLIARYKKRGLQLGLAVYILYLGNTAYELVGGARPDLLGLLTIVLAVAALYYIYRYLTHDPETEFFA